MTYFLILEQKDSEAVDDVITFETLEELKEYIDDAYFPDTWDYRLIEGAEKTMVIEITHTVNHILEVKE